jgi:hypothetical protein
MGQYTFYTSTNIRLLDISNIKTFNGITFGGVVANLIDVWMGKNLQNSLNLNSANWNPANAYSVSSNSLVPAEYREEHPEWVNRDYLLYCIREHFAANLPDRTGLTSLTITFNPTMKNIITASTETYNMFINKNWTVS